MSKKSFGDMLVTQYKYGKKVTKCIKLVGSVVKSTCLHAKVERAKMTSMSVNGPFVGDISIRIPLKKPSLVVLLLADSFVEEYNGLGAIYFPFSVPCSSQNTSNSPLPPNSDEKEHAWMLLCLQVVRYASTYKNDDNNSAYENSKFFTRMDITKLKIMTNSTGVLTISVHVRVGQCREDHSMKFKQENIGFMKQFEGCWRTKPIFVNEKT
ncbi:hypothetical protein V6N13_036692 [Hibiscus sabdariffa]